MMTQIRKQIASPRREEESPGSGCCGDLEGLLAPSFFKALGDPNRVAILARLVQCCRPCSVGEIGAGSPVSLSVVSRHLAMLRAAGILEAEKNGRTVFYTVRYPQLVRTLRQLAEAIEACCPGGDVDATASGTPA